MNQHKVSIIVAIYNSEKFLHKLIESIINQTHRNLEIILVNDGSPDNSGAICDNYAQLDNRIKVIHKKNGGACEARNVGLDIATGDYITIIDGDDWLEPDYVEYLLKLIVTTNSDMSMTDSVFTTADRVQNKTDCISVLSSEDAACKIIYPIIPIGPWNKLYSRALLQNNHLRFTRPWSGEGLCFAVEAAQLSRRVVMGHRKIYNYRLNNSGSGLTNYNVVMGTNALENIIYIKNNMLINSDKLLAAINWHIWKNHSFTLFLILATQSSEKNKSLVLKCKRYLRANLINVLFTSQVSIKLKIKMLVEAIIPVVFNTWKVRKAEARRKNMQWNK